MTSDTPTAWPTGIGAITLFVEDVPAAKEFYRAVFGLPVHFEDDVSVVFKFGETLVIFCSRARLASSSRRSLSRGWAAAPGFS